MITGPAAEPRACIEDAKLESTNSKIGASEILAGDSMIVEAAPSELTSVRDFDEKSMFSEYVPGETMIESPLAAASIAS
jgi:hypothetical protein